MDRDGSSRAASYFSGTGSRERLRPALEVVESRVPMKQPKPLPNKGAWKLRVIPEPEIEGRAVLSYQGEGTVLISGPEVGAPNLCCGSCGALLVTGFAPTGIANVVLHCNRCSSFNDTRPAADVN